MKTIILLTANSLHVIGRTSTGTPDQLSFFKSSKCNKLLSIKAWNFASLLVSTSAS